jgi:hypothetical protein
MQLSIAAHAKASCLVRQSLLHANPWNTVSAVLTLILRRVLLNIVLRESSGSAKEFGLTPFGITDRKLLKLYRLECLMVRFS